MKKHFGIWILLICILTLIGCVSILRGIYAVEGYSRYETLPAQSSASDRKTAEDFLASDPPDEAKYEQLTQYFLHGFVSHATRDYAQIHYRGYFGRGYTVNGLEGFARTAPLFAARIHSGRNPVILDPETGERIDTVSMLRSGLLAGTDPASGSYWGPIEITKKRWIGNTYNDQRIVETADIARILWLTKEAIWDRLSAAEKQQIAAWLMPVNAVTIFRRNNWILFPVTVNSFLKNVGYLQTFDDSAYYEFKRSYLEHGWFSDGQAGAVDYYNAWSISYELFWIHQFDPQLDGAFIERAITESAGLIAHLISPQGIPIMGRSECYRTGIPAAVIAGSMINPEAVRAGKSRRALDVVWKYFLRHGILLDGAETMGYFQTDPRLVDNYSGPGSCHWGLRSLTLAYMNNSQSDFWSAPTEPLPVEVGDYRLELPKAGWTITGEKATGEIQIQLSKEDRQSARLEPYDMQRKLVEWLLHHPDRPDNSTLKYHMKTYSALHPLGGQIAE